MLVRDESLSLRHPERWTLAVPCFIPRSGEGWKGRSLTDEHLNRFVSAVVGLFCSTGHRHVLLASDGRRESREIASQLGAYLDEVGAHTSRILPPVTAPLLSHAVRVSGARCGIYVTASHRPNDWVGLKVKGAHGGAISDATCAEIERRMAFEQAGKRLRGTTTELDRHAVLSSYVAELGQRLDSIPRCERRLRVLYPECCPAMDLFDIAKILDIAVHATFVEMATDADLDVISVLHAFEERGRYSPEFTVALDPDADSVGVHQPQMVELSTHLSFLLIAEQQRQAQNNVCAVAELGMLPGLEEILAPWGGAVTYADARFVGLSGLARSNQATMCGDENGNIGVRAINHRRDGLAAAIMAYSVSQELPEVVTKLKRRRADRYVRLDLAANTDAKADAVMRQLEQVLNWRRTSVEAQADTVILRADDSRWLLVRRSTTTPSFRIRGEVNDNSRTRLQSFVALQTSKDLVMR